VIYAYPKKLVIKTGEMFLLKCGLGYFVAALCY